ncbi:unnamed protein product [Pedinophyceae sp. YPF-701]|nr:unnamed protein product [Pedinophyceae sp. YPF-701]
MSTNISRFQSQTLRGLSVAGLLLSAVTIWVAIHGEYDTARWEGIELALCAAAANVCGLTAALLGPKRLRNALICQLILSLISVNLAIEFRASAARGRVVDCAIAESFVRLHHLEHAVHKHDENAVTMALYTRLGELDDMLDLTKQAVGVGSKADRHIESLRHMDEQYIMRKVQDLHKHALDVTEHLRRVELDKNSTATDAENAREARAEAQAVSEYADRLADITEWLGAAAKGKDTVPNTEEYQQILDVLLEAVQQYPHAHAQQRLGREAVEAPWVKASLGRAIENKYSSHHTQHQQVRGAAPPWVQTGRPCPPGRENGICGFTCVCVRALGAGAAGDAGRHAQGVAGGVRELLRGAHRRGRGAAGPPRPHYR